MSVKDTIHRIAALETELTTATHALSIAVERVRVLERQWIPVSERKPTHPHTVLGWVVSGPLVYGDPFMDSVVYLPDDDVWLQEVAGENAVVNVSHWMPLPEPPKETTP